MKTNTFSYDDDDILALLNSEPSNSKCIKF